MQIARKKAGRDQKPPGCQLSGWRAGGLSLAQQFGVGVPALNG